MLRTYLSLITMNYTKMERMLLTAELMGGAWRPAPPLSECGDGWSYKVQPHPFYYHIPPPMMSGEGAGRHLALQWTQLAKIQFCIIGAIYLSLCGMTNWLGGNWKTARTQVNEFWVSFEINCKNCSVAQFFLLMVLVWYGFLNLWFHNQYSFHNQWIHLCITFVFSRHVIYHNIWQ